MSDGAADAEVTLRKGRREDSDFIFRMLRLLAEDVGETAEFESTAQDVRRDAFGARPCYETLIAEWQGRPAGLATYFFTYSTYKGRRCLYVNDLIVAPAARRANLGRILMAELSRLALAQSCCRLELKVLQDNKARRFYQRIGMLESGEVSCSLKGTALEQLAKSIDRSELS